MKKIIIALALVTMFGCSTANICIQVSPIAKKTTDGKHVYFLDNEIGNIIYKMWTKGAFGYQTQPHLVDSLKFISIPSVISVRSVTIQTSNKKI